MSHLSFFYECCRLWKNAELTPDQIQKKSLRAFHRILDYAWCKTRFYPDYWKRHGIDYDDLKFIKPEEIPCITKEDVRKNIKEIATTLTQKNDGSQDAFSRSFVVHSSGSTGEPMRFLYGENALAIVEANFVRLSNLGGKNRIRWKDFPIQNIHAASVGTGYASSLLLTSGLAKYHAQCILLKASDPLDKWVETIGHMQPNYISGYPSCVAILLDLQKKGLICLHPLKVITGGEPLRSNLKSELEDVFQADIIDFYGCCESLLIGAGSSWYAGMYLFDDMNYTETDADGHLIVTPFYNPTFPLIRYRLDDLVQGFSRSFNGPLPFTHIDRIVGRDEDILWFLNEKGHPDFLHPLVLDDLKADGLKAYQFVQKNDRCFRVDCIMEPEREETKEDICRQIDSMLQSKKMKNLSYEIRFCNDLQRNPRSGKIPLTIKKLKENEQ